MVAIYFPLQHFAFGVVKISLLDKTVAFYHNELLKLSVVPVLTLGNTGLGDIDTHLSCIEGVHQLGEATTVVHVHLEREGNLVVWQVTEVGGRQNS